MTGGTPDRLLQRWGVVAGAGVVAAALAVSTLTAPEETSPTPAPSETADPTGAPPAATPAPTTPGASAEPGGKTVAEAASGGEPTPIAESAQAGGPPPRGAAYPSLIVRFETQHPMARAQALAAAGRYEEAAESARQTIRTRRDLRGLCYDRFTNGGAEVVLRACSAVPRAQRLRFQETWTERLNAADDVDYAEPNYTLMPEGQK